MLITSASYAAICKTSDLATLEVASHRFKRILRVYNNNDNNSSNILMAIKPTEGQCLLTDYWSHLSVGRGEKSSLV